VQLITVTLDDKTSEALDRWLAKTAAAAGPPRLTAEEAIPAMVRVCLGFTDISNLVASHIRAERAAETLDIYRSLGYALERTRRACATRCCGRGG
jgi:hypothetical protein